MELRKSFCLFLPGLYRHISIGCTNLCRDVALILHAHHLAPVHFDRDINANIHYADLAGRLDFQLFRFAGRLQNLKLGDDVSATAWKSMYPMYPFQVFEVAEDIYKGRNPFFAKLIDGHPPQASSTLNTRPKFGLNLAEAVVRQWEFAEKITKHYVQDPVPLEALEHSKVRYAKFMNLMRVQTRTIVPTLDVDLFWHTHQLSSVEYGNWCRTWIGRPINHDDTIEPGPLVDGLQYTKEIWMQNYNEEYLGTPPSISAHQAPSGQVFKLVRPPPTLSARQKELWDFDVEKQQKYQAYQYTLLQIKERDKQADRLALREELQRVTDQYIVAKHEWETQFPAPPRPSLASVRAQAPNGQMQDNYRNTSATRESRGFLSNMVTVARSIKALHEQGQVLAVHTEAFEQQKRARDAALNQAMRPWREQVSQIQRKVDELKDHAFRTTSIYEQQRALWRNQRFNILKDTGAIAEEARKEPGFLGINKYIPKVDAIMFPLYAANWYAFTPVGVYDYSTEFFDANVGEEAGGFRCGTNMDGGKPPPLSIHGCSSCGGSCS
jgi:hypothetical protein